MSRMWLAPLCETPTEKSPMRGFFTWVGGCLPVGFSYLMAPAVGPASLLLD
jgi:hypothetical protein